MKIIECGFCFDVHFNFQSIFLSSTPLFIVSENEMEGQLYMADWGM
jgi:hypothetical protein